MVTVRDVPTVLAVDIGGTKLAAALVDETGLVRGRRAVATPETDDAEELWGVLASLIAPLVDGGAVDACGVGCGGPMSPLGEEVSPLNIPAWASSMAISAVRSGYPMGIRMRKRSSCDSGRG